MKVKAGIRLLMADERVGELYSSPLFPSNWQNSPSAERQTILKKKEILLGGSSGDLM